MQVAVDGAARHAKLGRKVGDVGLGVGATQPLQYLALASQSFGEARSGSFCSIFSARSRD